LSNTWEIGQGEDIDTFILIYICKKCMSIHSIWTFPYIILFTETLNMLLKNNFSLFIDTLNLLLKNIGRIIFHFDFVIVERYIEVHLQDHDINFSFWFCNCKKVYEFLYIDHEIDFSFLERNIHNVMHLQKHW
jgi:hypothetical protein